MKNNPECKINQKPQAPAPATGKQACPWSGLPRRGDVRRQAGLLQMAGMGAPVCNPPTPRERPVGKQGRQSPCVLLASSRCLTVSLPHLASREEAQQEHSRARASEIVGTLLPHHRHRFLPRVSDADSASSILESTACIRDKTAKAEVFLGRAVPGERCRQTCTRERPMFSHVWGLHPLASTRRSPVPPCRWFGGSGPQISPPARA